MDTTTRYIETPTSTDDAVLDFLSRRVEALALSIAAWTPQTGIADDAHHDLTNAVDRLREVIGVARQGLEVVA